MANCTKLIAKARASTANLRFAEALALAECLGFVHVRTKGSHHYFKRDGYEQAVSLQPDKRDSSKAKSRQVEQLLRIFEDIGVGEDE